MRKRVGQATAVIDAPPDAVFAMITDLRPLPAGNDRLVVAPAGVLAEGAEWVVVMKVMGRRLRSRAHVIELDRSERRFVYRSKLEDDNPSFSIWTWAVEPAGANGTSHVTLGWELRPVTFVRKRLISPLRNHQIGCREAPATLAALRKACR